MTFDGANRTQTLPGTWSLRQTREWPNVRLGRKTDWKVSLSHFSTFKKKSVIPNHPPPPSSWHTWTCNNNNIHNIFKIYTKNLKQFILLEKDWLHRITWESRICSLQWKWWTILFASLFLWLHFISPTFNLVQILNHYKRTVIKMHIRKT